MEEPFHLFPMVQRRIIQSRTNRQTQHSSYTHTQLLYSRQQRHTHGNKRRGEEPRGVVCLSLSLSPYNEKEWALRGSSNSKVVCFGFSFPNQLLHVAELSSIERQAAHSSGLTGWWVGWQREYSWIWPLSVINDVDDERFPISLDCKNVKNKRDIETHVYVKEAKGRRN
jgi:hypothetical protein